jgi:hypothetical protein
MRENYQKMMDDQPWIFNSRYWRRWRKFQAKKIKNLMAEEMRIIILMSAHLKKNKVMLDMPSKINDWILRAKAIRKALADNTLGYFTPAWTGLAQLVTDLLALDERQLDVENGVADAVNARNMAMNKVELDLDNCALYIQGLVNAAPDYATAKSIAEAALMKLVEHTAAKKAPLAAVRGKLSGQIKITATALGKNVAYEYQYSLDGITWVALGSSKKAKYIANGLNPLVKYWFRMRNADGPGEWIYCVPVICL